MIKINETKLSAGGDIACNLAICIKSPTELKELTDDTCDSSLKLLCGFLELCQITSMGQHIQISFSLRFRYLAFIWSISGASMHWDGW